MPGISRTVPIQYQQETRPPEAFVHWSAWSMLVLLCSGVLLVSHPADWPALALQSIALLLAGVWLAEYVRCPFPLRTNWVVAGLSFAALWGGVQAAAGWTTDRDATVRAALTWGCHAAVFWLALQIFGAPRLRSAATRIMAVFGFLVSVIASLQVFSSGGRIFWVFETPYGDGVMGPFVNRDHYSAFLSLIHI